MMQKRRHPNEIGELDYAAAKSFFDAQEAPPCTYCRCDMAPNPSASAITLADNSMTRDHVWSNGLRNPKEGRSGTIPCCAECNQLKGSKTPREWFIHMHKHPERFWFWKGKEL